MRAFKFKRSSCEDEDALRSSLRQPFAAAAAATGAYLMLVAGGAASNGGAATSFGLQTLSASRPLITCVSGFLPQRKQNLVIRGRGFGFHEPYRNLSIASIRLSNITRGWTAGFKRLPRFNALVTLDVSWRDTRIVVTGFAGPYGQRGWVVRPRDRMRVEVWNTATGSGPASSVLTAGSIKRC